MARAIVEQTEFIHEENLGQVKLSDQVLAVCAVNATMKVPGVAGLTGGLTDSLQENLLRKESMTKGVKVDQNDEGCVVDVSVIVEYGCKIPQVAFDLQNRIKQEIETMTDRKVLRVNVHVEGVVVPEERA